MCFSILARKDGDRRNNLLKVADASVLFAPLESMLHTLAFKVNVGQIHGCFRYSTMHIGLKEHSLDHLAHFCGPALVGIIGSKDCMDGVRFKNQNTGKLNFVAIADRLRLVCADHKLDTSGMPLGGHSACKFALRCCMHLFC